MVVAIPRRPGSPRVADNRASRKKMFGGIVFMLNGNMLVGVWEQSLIVRLGPSQAATAIEEPHVRAFDVGGPTDEGLGDG